MLGSFSFVLDDEDSGSNRSLDGNEIASEDESENDKNSEEDSMNQILNDPDFQHMSDSDMDDLPLFDNAESSGEEDDSQVDNLQRIDVDSERKKLAREAKEKKQNEINTKTSEYMQNALESLRSRSGKITKESKKSKDVPFERSEVEDQFFKLDEMEKFLDSEDALANRKISREEKGFPGDDKHDDDLDLFVDDSSGEEARNVKYKEYFYNDSNDTELDNNENGKTYRNNSSDDQPSENSETEHSNTRPSRLLSEEDDEDLGEVKSTYELRQIRLKKKIQRMEQDAINQAGGDEKKLWQMKGEITAAERPENSLLQEHLDYDTVSKQAPIITEQVSKRLEDIIVQRIKDRAFDNVERKIKPIENPYEYKKKLILDQEKSKLSLAEVYEQEYLKQKNALEESLNTPGMLDNQGNDETPKEVESLRKSMKILFSKLDSLTHFHFTPKGKISTPPF